VSDNSSGIRTLLLGFVAVIVVLAIVDPQLIPLAANVFVFLFVDHVEGLVVGAIVGAIPILGSRAEEGAEVFGFTISVGALAGAVLQFLLFR